MSFPRHGGEFRLKFGLGEMHSIANFARNFAQRKNAQHSKFRNEFRETLACPKLSRVLARGPAVARVRVAFRFHGFTGDSARRAVPSARPRADTPRQNTATRQNRNSHILSYSFVPPRARAHEVTSHTAAPHSHHTRHIPHTTLDPFIMLLPCLRLCCTLLLPLDAALGPVNWMSQPGLLDQ